MGSTGIVLVTGATGQQGGSVARHLLQQNQKVRVMTRTPAKAEALAKLGAEVVQGDMADPKSLAAALQGVSGVFAMTTPYEGIEKEVQQGIALADAAKAAGVSHYVYTSVQSAERNTGIPHFETKWKVEQHIKKIGLPATILRPAFFMENFASPWFWPSISQGKIVMPLKADTSLQMVEVEDIGAFGAAAFMQPEKFIGKEISLAGDALTMPEAATILTKTLGKTITFETFPEDQAVGALGADFAKMFKWFDEVGYNTDIPELKQQYGIPLTSFEQSAPKTQWPAA